IPLGSRIIAVADFFEAITAKRHYRDPLPLSEALRLVIEVEGTHLDPEVVDAFLRYWHKAAGSQPLLDVLTPHSSPFLHPRQVMSGE
ncbi:MAG TPA: HD domain-containing phosphohydrolase, partial [Thermodesulfovibrionales bacterium]|nr:HD domain-containing phosphohydrolase [Thermodesulfovibrionales bacterium]